MTRRTRLAAAGGRNRGGERGTAAVEFAVIVPALGLLISMMIGAGRVWFAHGQVEQIAGTAARAASASRTPVEARAAAERVARSQSTTTGLACASLDVDVDVTGFAVAVGEPARVQARVRCAVPLSDLLVPGWPGRWELTAEATSALDRYRRRS